MLENTFTQDVYCGLLIKVARWTPEIRTTKVCTPNNTFEVFRIGVKSKNSSFIDCVREFEMLYWGIESRPLLTENIYWINGPSWMANLLHQEVSVFFSSAHCRIAISWTSLGSHCMIFILFSRLGIISEMEMRWIYER